MSIKVGLLVLLVVVGCQVFALISYYTFFERIAIWRASRDQKRAEIENVKFKSNFEENENGGKNINRKSLISNSKITSSLSSQFTDDNQTVRIISSTKWILTPQIFYGEGENSKKSKKRTDFLLLVRKLVLFIIHGVNQQIKNQTKCGHWWVNPISVNEIEERLILLSTSKNFSTIYNLSFEIQPGRIQFEGLVLLHHRDNSTLYSSDDLEFISGRRLDEIPKICGQVPPHLHQICICPQEKQDFEKKSMKLRQLWEVSDPELLTWPPNKPMFVPDYITFGTMELYYQSPIQNSKFCGLMMKMILFISSAPSHKLQRDTIRKTFGNFNFLKKHGIGLVFLFGKIKNTTLQREIDDEFLLHDDIVQANFDDSYHNLTLSHLSMYNWVVTYCEHHGSRVPPWILKADDDFFLNPVLAVKIAEANPNVEMIGCLFCGTKAIRSVAYMTKYYVPRYMYAPDWYLGYVSGVAYIVQTKIIKSMLKASLTIPIIHMDDAYVMGLVTREVGIRPMNSQFFTYGRTEPHFCNSKLMVSSYVFNSTDMINQWNHFQKPIERNFSCTLQKSELKVGKLTSWHNTECLYE